MVGASLSLLLVPIDITVGKSFEKERKRERERVPTPIDAWLINKHATVPAYDISNIIARAGSDAHLICLI